MNLKCCILLFIIAVFCANSSIIGQANTLVMGQMNQHNKLVKTVELHVNNRYIDNEIEIFESNLLADGSFAFAVNVVEPQYATFRYSQNKVLVYLEPNDTLVIYGEGPSFPFSTAFSGRGGANNRYLYKYLDRHPKELNPFKLLQYRKGNYWYYVDVDMDNKMKNNHPEAFYKMLLLKKEQALMDLEFNVANQPGYLSDSFKEFLSAEIIYDWAYHLMLYGSVLKNKHKLTDEWFSFLDEVPINSKMIGNYRYRDFLMAYFNYLITKEIDQPQNPYLKQYELATQLMTGRPQAFVQSELIFKSFAAKNMEELLDRYWDFVRNTDYPEFNDKVVAAYEKALKQTVGAPAPDFKLNDELGRVVTLSNYRGQVVLLNFWASWCRPCMAKMRMMQPIEEELKSKGVVFMNVSLDRNESDWKRAIQSGDFGGVHLLANGDIDSQVATDYEVRILPQYFLINKEGQFAEKPEKFKPEDLKLTLNRLSR